MKVAIFDIDGVIAEVSERLRATLQEMHTEDLRKIPKEKRKDFWRIFLSPRYMNLDKPIMENIEYIRRCKEKGVKIILITGRREDTQKEQTIEQLNKWNVPYDKIYFRRRGDLRRDIQYKISIIKRMIKKGLEITEVWDDNREIIDKIKEKFPTIKVRYIG